MKYQNFAMLPNSTITRGVFFVSKREQIYFMCFNIDCGYFFLCIFVVVVESHVFILIERFITRHSNLRTDKINEIWNLKIAWQIFFFVLFPSSYYYFYLLLFILIILSFCFTIVAVVRSSFSFSWFHAWKYMSSNHMKRAVCCVIFHFRDFLMQKILITRRKTRGANEWSWRLAEEFFFEMLAYSESSQN